MNIIRDLIYGNPYNLSKGLDRLQERADDLCRERAEQLNLDILPALTNLDEFEAYLPDPAEVVARLMRKQLGDWQSVLRVTATMVTQAALDAEVEADLGIIKRAIHEAELSGYQARKLYGSNVYSWAPHYTESDWSHGTLIEWRFHDGQFDVALLEVNLTGFADIWIDLALVD